MKFEEWMQANGLSESSVEKYAGAIDGPLTDWAKSHGILSVPIREITNPAEFGEVSKKIAATQEYAVRNKRGHQMYGAALKKFGEFLNAIPKSVGNGGYSYGPYSLMVTELEAAEEFQPYLPQGQEDARTKVLREVVQRRGQPKFRAALIDAYESRCAITGCTVLPILEAAHITPYLGPATNMLGNGLLLRADIHTLWDLGLIAIEPASMQIWLSPKVADEAYRGLDGTTAFQPKDPCNRASPEALEQQWELARNTMFEQT